MCDLCDIKTVAAQYKARKNYINKELVFGGVITNNTYSLYHSDNYFLDMNR